ncbi:hypothetical protein Hanom_Chr05g00434791 [Helianthus anomalus]
MWLTKILDLIPSFPKVHRWSLWFAFVTHLVPKFCQKYMYGPCGLHFIMHLVSNLDLQKIHRDYPCIFEKLGTRSKTLAKHRDPPCTLLEIL